MEDEVSVAEPRSLVVFSRDWTVETVVRQIERGNIELNPKFQRRNAWNDDKRSKLIESLLIGVPVPEIVMAEDKEKRGSFLVIDGKQRLLAVAGYLEPKFNFWNAAKLRGLKTRAELNGKSFTELGNKDGESQDQRELRNADIRCTIISNYADVGVLYDIFYRLNAGSVPLSSQELRQALNRGPFADFIIDATNHVIPLHFVLRLTAPDPRLRDAEILLRYISFSLFGKRYAGALSPFLDSSMAEINKGWVTENLRASVERVLAEFNDATTRLLNTFPTNRVGRRYTGENWEGNFNRALFEVEAYYFARIPQQVFTDENKRRFMEEFQNVCANNVAFRESIGATTKTVDRYRTRFSVFQAVVNNTFGTELNNIPLPAPTK